MTHKTLERTLPRAASTLPPDDAAEVLIRLSDEVEQQVTAAKQRAAQVLVRQRQTAPVKNTDRVRYAYD